jgi:AraC-like DNA-binding protein
VPVVVVDCAFDAPGSHGLYRPEVVARAHVIVRGHGRTCRRNLGAGPASISAVTRGEAAWATSEGRYLVRPGACLVLGEGDACSLTIDSPTPVETFCVSFRTGFLSGLAWELRSDVATALDDPDGATAEVPPLHAGIHPNSDRVGAAMDRLRSGVTARVPAAELEEAIIAAGCAVLRANAEYLSRSSRVSAVRASTRREILRRVFRGRDYIESHLPDHFALRDIGRAAAMSVFHFHRSFVEVFGETPHEYTTRRRLALAMDLLASTDLTIGDVSFAAGFGSPTSFSAAFRRHEAHSPTAFRRTRRGARASGQDRKVDRRRLIAGQFNGR